MSRFTAKRIATNAVFVALYFVLSMYCSINISKEFRFTLDALPIILGALLFGPADAIIIGGLGSFLYQLMSYGLGPTTVLWMLPAIFRGALIGLVAKWKNFHLKNWEIIVTVVVSSILVTLLNTLVMVLDGIIYGYTAAVLVTLPWRILCSLIVAVIYGVLTPQLLKGLKRVNCRA